MEKYAVDLEKVLDEFEFKEKHLHNYSSNQRAIDDAYNINENIYPRAYRTPAANYRRPQFEPMNLADADFSVSQISRTCHKAKNNNLLSDRNPDLDQSTDAAEQGGSEFIPPIQDSASIDYSFTFTLNDKNDYKPDLIESNAEICSSSNSFERLERNLPDIASANVVSKEKDMLAHIDVDSDADVVESKNQLETTGTGVEVSEDESSTSTHVQPKVISFQISDNVTDDALHQYLEELAENDGINSKNDCIVFDSDRSLHTEDATEITEDSSYSITELKDDVGNETETEAECSSSDNFDARKSNCSFKNDNQEYRILSDNVLLISSSAESQENLECDSTENDIECDSETASSNHSKSIDIIESNVECESCIDRSLEKPNQLLDATNSYTDQGDSGAQNDEFDIESQHITEEIPQMGIECDHITPTNHIDSNTNSNAMEKSIESESALCNYYENESIESNDEIATSSAIVERENPITVVYQEITTSDSNANRNLAIDSRLSAPKLDSNYEASNMESKTDESLSSHNDESANTPKHVPEEDFYSDGERADKCNISSDIASDENHASTSQAKPQRPDFLDLTQNIQNPDMSSTSADSGSILSVEERKLGKEPPYWIPDSDTTVCMHCQLKFNPVIRRRHHCRACGLVVCAKCSDRKASLEYLGFKEDRVCHTCHSILQKISNIESDPSSVAKKPNPNNPMEYCSKIPPLLQVGSTHHPTPSVLVPKVGVLKREGRPKTNDSPKQVIFSDGIRPGGDLTELDASPEQPRLPLRRSSRITKRVGTPPGLTDIHRRHLNPETRSFIPSGADLPPLVTKIQGECVYSELESALNIDNEPVKFAINRNLFAVVSRLILDCCVHKEVWCITTEGLSCVGQDEIVFIMEVLPDEKHPPKDVFSTINTLYQDASKGSTVTEMSYMSPCTNQLFGSKEHGGFVFIRPTYQCVQKLRLPKPPFLIALLIHRWETPWARLFPIRLVLRLGAEYRYYPCPLVSVRNRPALFSEIGHTIFTLLADFRKYSYTLPTVRGLMIHMEDRLTTILLPRNRYDQVIRALNNSEENVLAFAGNISTIADSHLVCIQSIQQEDTAYQTQAINILNKPRQITGASFVVFNGSLKQCSWSGKSNIVEDGLMVQIPSESMAALRTALRQMKNYSIGCGPQAEEMVVLKWAPDDVNFNIGVKSEIDNRPLDGIPSIRVHNGTDYSGILRLIRWTEVFIIQSDEESNSRTGDSINISKLSESVAKSTCVALLPLLDLLAAANLTTIAVRVTIHPENVGYEAGSKGEKLPPIYMKSLDEELIAIINKAAVSIGDMLNPVILELIFKVMEQG